MKSPCIKVCQMEPQRGLCTGCGRTLDEIARWGGMTEEQREAVLAELPRRQEQQRALDESAAPPLA